VEYFWTAGTLLVPLVAYFSLGQGDNSDQDNDWRIFVAACAIPCFVSTIFGLLYVPESPRWLLTRGDPQSALIILRDAAQRNGHNPDELFPIDTRLSYNHVEESSNIVDLIRPKWRRTTLLLCAAWAGFAFVYYGSIYVVTLIFAKTEQNEEGKATYSFDYEALFASASSEVAGTTLVILLIDRIGRTNTQVLSYVGGGISVLILCLLATPRDAHGNADTSRSVLMTFAFLSRLFFMGGTCSTWVSTAEILTTEVRTTGHSVANAVARVGGALCPFLVSKSTPYPIVGVCLCVISMITATACHHLPETKGRSMGDTLSSATINEACIEATSTGDIPIVAHSPMNVCDSGTPQEVV
jgi:MFS family permease